MTNNQIRQLRGLAHHLKPVVRLGQAGLTEAVSKELDLALRRHELVKIKLSGDKAERAVQLEGLCAGADAQLVQQIGHTATVFRRNQDKPVITLNK